jgi:hypothetical protein
MLGVCLVGVLISTFFPVNGSENTKEPLLVEHHIEAQTSGEDIDLKMSSETSDSLLSVD